MTEVLIIAPTMRKGGMERQLATFLQFFDRSKLKITLALFNQEIEYQLPADISIINLKKRKSPDLAFAIRLSTLLASKKYDVIDCKLSTISFNIMLVCGFLLKQNLIIEVRSHGSHLITFYKRVKILHGIFRKEWMVITNSKGALNQATRYLPASVNLIYIANGFDTNRFRNIHLEKKDNFRIGYVGRILPLKNLETLIKAVSVFKNKLECKVILEFCGNVDDQNYLSQLKNLAQALNMSETTRFIESVEAVELQYNSLDLFVLPSYYEGTPNVLLEAMSCERICLTSKGANSDNFLSEDFVFETTDYQQLAEKIYKIYHLDDSHSTAIKKSNRELILNNYKWEDMVEGFTEAFVRQSSKVERDRWSATPPLDIKNI